MPIPRGILYPRVFEHTTLRTGVPIPAQVVRVHAAGSSSVHFDDNHEDIADDDGNGSGASEEDAAEDGNEQEATGGKQRRNESGTPAKRARNGHGTLAKCPWNKNPRRCRRKRNKEHPVPTQA